MLPDSPYAILSCCSDSNVLQTGQLPCSNRVNGSGDRQLPPPLVPISLSLFLSRPRSEFPRFPARPTRRFEDNLSERRYSA
jgi:hypothetical protein